MPNLVFQDVEGADKKRLNLFRIYSTNLSFYRSEFAGKFVCPVCWNAFEEKDTIGPQSVLCLAHVYPIALGGNLVTLSCTKCDNTIGANLDSHLARKHELYDLFEGRRQDRGRLRTASGDIAVNMNRTEGGGWNLMEVPNQAAPGADLKVFQDIKQNGRFSLVQRGYRPNHADLALLHTAHLMLFRTLGYEYFSSRTAHIIRDLLLMDKVPEKMPFYFFTVTEWSNTDMKPDGRVWIRLKPRANRSLLVFLPSPGAKNHIASGVWMPGFGEDAEKDFDAAAANGQTRISDGELGYFDSGEAHDRLIDRGFVGYGHYLFR